MENIYIEDIWKRDFKDADMIKVEEETRIEASSNTEQCINKYNALEQSRNGNYISSDLMKLVFTRYANNIEFRRKYNLAVSNSAACLSNELYTRTIKNSNISRCIYVAGPYGAGKSFFVQSLFLVNMIPDNTIVYEGSITAPSFGEKVGLAIKNNITPEIIVLNPTLELSMQNIKQRAAETGRDVIKSEIVDKYANIYTNMQKLFEQVNTNISFQIYNKSSNAPEDLSVSYNLDDLKHGTIQEVSEQYDTIIKKLFISVLEDSEPQL